MNSYLLPKLRDIERNPDFPRAVAPAIALMADLTRCKGGLAALVDAFEESNSEEITRALINVIAKHPGDVLESEQFEFSLRIAIHYREGWERGTVEMLLGNLSSFWTDAVALRFDLRQLEPFIDAFVTSTGLRSHYDLSCFEDLIGAAGGLSLRFLSPDSRSRGIERIKGAFSSPDWIRQAFAVEAERDGRVLAILSGEVEPRAE